MSGFKKLMVVLALYASPALAETCMFTVECFEAEDCAATSFEISLEEGLLITDAETIPVTQDGSEAVRVYVGVTDSAFHLLTAGETGPARYTTHIYDGPLVVTFMGECRP